MGKISRLRSVVTRSKGLVGALVVMTVLLLCSLWLSDGTAASSVTVTKADFGDEVGDEQQIVYSGDLRLRLGECSSDVMRFGHSDVTLNFVSNDARLDEGVDMVVELHRVAGGLIDEYVSRETISTTGLSVVTWRGVGPGDYYLKFMAPAGVDEVGGRISVLSVLDE